MEYYTLFNSTNGLHEVKKNLTSNEATEEMNELLECFPDQQFEIHPQIEYLKEKEYKPIPRGAADGWEDLHWNN